MNTTHKEESQIVQTEIEVAIIVKSPIWAQKRRITSSIIETCGAAKAAIKKKSEAL
jgi:hypothetical protein